jgi:hypothetical protein
MTALPAPQNPKLSAEIAQLARAYRRASGPLMALMQRFGGSLESQMAQLPAPVRSQIESAIITALTAAHGLAARAESRIENHADLGRRNTLIAAMATGAAGGAGGLTTALIEMPLTITILLHAIRSEARAAGFDPDTPGIRAACLEVFADASPLREDDGMNTAFISARLAINGAALHKIIATIAPRLTLVFGQKLSFQAVPILGAAAGASINAAYLRYYREIARIRFALMRLAISHGGEAVATAFTRAAAQPILRAK